MEESKHKGQITIKKEEKKPCEHDNAIIYGKWDTREMYCPDCNIKFYDCSI